MTRVRLQSVMRINGKIMNKIGLIGGKNSGLRPIIARTGVQCGTRARARAQSVTRIKAQVISRSGLSLYLRLCL